MSKASFANARQRCAGQGCGIEMQRALSCYEQFQVLMIEKVIITAFVHWKPHQCPTIPVPSNSKNEICARSLIRLNSVMYTFS